MARKTGLKGLQEWAKHVTSGYSNVEITNLTTSFKNGLAFCAIIHHFRPELIPYGELKKENVFDNNQLAFSVAENELDIPALLDAEDMVALSVPDKLSIATYLVSYYNYFKDQPPPAKQQKLDPAQNKENSPSKAPEPDTNTAKRSRKSKFTKPSTDVNSDTLKRGTMGKEECEVCKERVFLVERLGVENRVFHRACFKCCTCLVVLKPGSYEHDPETNKFYCEQHYRESVRQATLKRSMAERGIPASEIPAPLKPRRSKKYKKDDEAPSKVETTTPSKAQDKSEIKTGLPSLLKNLAATKQQQDDKKPEDKASAGKVSPSHLSTVPQQRGPDKTTTSVLKPASPIVSRQNQQAKDERTSGIGNVKAMSGNLNKQAEQQAKDDKNKSIGASKPVYSQQQTTEDKASIKPSTSAIPTKPPPPKFYSSPTKQATGKGSITLQVKSTKSSPSIVTPEPSRATVLKPTEPVKKVDVTPKQPEQPKKVWGTQTANSSKTSPEVVTKTQESPKRAWELPKQSPSPKHTREEPKQTDPVKSTGNVAKQVAQVNKIEDAPKPVDLPKQTITIKPSEVPKKSETVAKVPEPVTTETPSQPPPSKPPRGNGTPVLPSKPPRRKKFQSPADEAPSGPPLPVVSKPPEVKRGSVKPKRPAPPRPTAPPSYKRQPSKKESTGALVDLVAVADKRKRRVAVLRRQLTEVEREQDELEQRGVALEKQLRQKGDDADDNLVEKYFVIVKEKNMLVRRESDLVYELKDLELIDQYETLDAEIRQRLTKDDSLKSEVERLEEEAMISELVELVEKRDKLLWNLHLEKTQDDEEDKKAELMTSTKLLTKSMSAVL